MKQNKNNPPKVLVVAGPTASGKSALSALLARAHRGQVISCDAMQIYRGMDIGTGKVTAEETLGVRHRLIDVLSPEEPFSLASYIDRARAEISQTLEEGYLPVLCGGTGLYLDRLLDGTELSAAPASAEVRQALEALSNDELYEELLRADPVSAEKTHRNNRKRVIRALEIYRVTGKPKSLWDERSHAQSPYNALRILLLPSDRDKLYETINRRVDTMFQRGLEEEVRALFARRPSQTAAQAIGYKEFLPYFEGRATIGEVKEAIKQASRNYAKRQVTWFRKDAGRCVVLDASLPPDEKFSAAQRAVIPFLHE